MQRGDRMIYELLNGKMVKVSEPSMPERANFVIVCQWGDWSGFRPLAKCEEQFADLEAKGRPDGFYAVVER